MIALCHRSLDVLRTERFLVTGFPLKVFNLDARTHILNGGNVITVQGLLSHIVQKNAHLLSGDVGSF